MNIMTVDNMLSKVDAQARGGGVIRFTKLLQGVIHPYPHPLVYPSPFMVPPPPPPGVASFNLRVAHCAKK